MLLPPRIDVAVSVGEQLVDYRCARCGMRAQVSVQGGGTGLRVSGASLSDATLDARVDAESAARLAPCPRCGHRDRVALAKVLLTGASMGLPAALAAGFAVVERLRDSDLAGAVGLQVAIGTFLAVVAAATAIKLRNVRGRVRFHRTVV